jgi:hypothetical protein
MTEKDAAILTMEVNYVLVFFLLTLIDAGMSALMYCFRFGRLHVCTPKEGFKSYLLS